MTARLLGLARLALVLFVWSGFAHATVSECPGLPPGAEPSESALQRHCDFAGLSCTTSAADPNGVKACGGLVCASDPGSTEQTCRLAQSAAECGLEVDLQRTGGLCDGSQVYKGKACRLEVHEERATDAAGPDADPEALPAASSNYQPSQYTVDNVCGGLGCVPDENSKDPTLGVCALVTDSKYCGGRITDPRQFGGWCGPPHVQGEKPSPLTPRRWMATGSYLVDLGNDSLGSDVAPGVVFQLGLGQSSVRTLPNGNTMHFGLPNWYLHLSGLMSRRRVAYEGGIVYKTGAELLTRVGLAAYGQFWSPEDIVSTSSEHRIGPSVHVELFYNILVRGAWLPLGGTGPEATLCLQYAATLFDDFK